MKKLLLSISTMLILLSCKNPKKVQHTHDVANANTVKTDSAYMAEGAAFAQNTQKILGKNLMQAMEKGGPAYALAFCNTKAMPLTDSMAVYHKVKISRVSDKPRNPNNKASSEQENVISTFKEQLVSNGEVQPILVKKEDQVHFYQPIITNNMCLKCHGDTQNDIDDKVIKSLADLYPEDRATGYAENEIRGAWHIVMEKE